MSQVYYKVREEQPPAGRTALIEEVMQLGATRAEPLFPDDRDPELASLYVVDCPPEAVQPIISYLEPLLAVQFAEEPAERKMMD